MAQLLGRDTMAAHRGSFWPAPCQQSRRPWVKLRRPTGQEKGRAGDAYSRPAAAAGQCCRRQATAPCGITAQAERAGRPAPPRSDRTAAATAGRLCDVTADLRWPGELTAGCHRRRDGVAPTGWTPLTRHTRQTRRVSPGRDCCAAPAVCRSEEESPPTCGQGGGAVT